MFYFLLAGSALIWLSNYSEGGGG